MKKKSLHRLNPSQPPTVKQDKENTIICGRQTRTNDKIHPPVPDLQCCSVSRESGSARDGELQHREQQSPVYTVLPTEY